MESLAEVREDLRDIRYYYAHKEMFDKTVKVTGEHELIRKAERTMRRCVRHRRGCMKCMSAYMYTVIRRNLWR